MVMGLVSLGGSELSLRPALRICDFVRVRLASPVSARLYPQRPHLTAKSSEVTKVTPSTHGQPAGQENRTQYSTDHTKQSQIHTNQAVEIV